MVYHFEVKASKNYNKVIKQEIKPEKRLGFGDFVDRVFWALITGSAIYAASQLRTLGENVSELNEKMAVVISRLGDYDRRIMFIEDIIREQSLKK